MAHGRVKPAGWSTSEKLTAAQQNQIDINISESLDKTTAGDTLSGTVSLAATGILSADAAGALIRTKTGGRIEHGDNDFPTLKTGHTGRTQPKARMCATGASYAAAWTIVFTSTVRPTLRGNATTDLVVIPLNDIVQDGATLTQVDLIFAIGSAHGSLPANQPNMVVERYKTDLTQSGLGSATLAAGSTAAYYNGGAQQTLSVTGLSSVIDKSQYTYGVILTDENGADSIAGNLFYWVKVTQTIVDLRPF